MQTKRLIIRPFYPNDIDDLHKLLSDKEVMQYLEPPFSMEKTAAFLKSAGLCEHSLIYAVISRSNDFIGYVIYHPYEYEKDSYEIGWVLGKEYWHKGYARELTEELIRDAQFKAKSVVIECSPQQVSTKKIALRNGFVYEGHKGGCDIYRLKF